MLITEYRCNRCGKKIQQEKIKYYGSQPIIDTGKHIFHIKHRFGGGRKDVQHWKSAIFCAECQQKLEETYNNFIEEGKKEIENVC